MDPVNAAGERTFRAVRVRVAHILDPVIVYADTVDVRLIGTSSRP